MRSNGLTTTLRTPSPKTRRIESGMSLEPKSPKAPTLSRAAYMFASTLHEVTRDRSSANRSENSSLGTSSSLLRNSRHKFFARRIRPALCVIGARRMKRLSHTELIQRLFNGFFYLAIVNLLRHEQVFPSPILGNVDDLLVRDGLSLKRDSTFIQYVIQYVIHSIIKLNTHLNERQPLCPCLKDLCR